MISLKGVAAKADTSSPVVQPLLASTGVSVGSSNMAHLTKPMEQGRARSPVPSALPLPSSLPKLNPTSSAPPQPSSSASSVSVPASSVGGNPPAPSSPHPPRLARSNNNGNNMINVKDNHDGRTSTAVVPDSRHQGDTSTKSDDGNSRAIARKTPPTLGAQSPQPPPPGVHVGSSKMAAVNHAYLCVR